MKQENFILVISSPSGAGKTSLAKSILNKDPNFVSSISVTTRAKRPGEVDGQDYYFVSKEEFDLMNNENQLLEDAKVFGNYYGSPKQHVLDKMKNGYDVLFDIDWQGAHTLKEKLGDLMVSIFILPPSLAELEQRLRARGQDSEEVVQERMNQAKEEIIHYDEYDYVLINKDFDKTLERISTIIASERLRHFDYSIFVDEIMK
jgi:guanylate kinase